MNNRQQNTGKMLSPEAIYKIMQYLPAGITAIFFLKNAAEGNTVAMIIIGLCLVMFLGIIVFVKVRKVSLYVREYIMAFALPLLVFLISLFSGASYSDDFPMFLAVIALTGLYLEPKFTRAQVFFADILLVIMYWVHPQKAGNTSQYILCMVVFTLAACLFYQVIKRGRAFIEIGQERAEEAEKLLESIRTMGAELQHDFMVSSEQIEASTGGLQRESVSITHGAGEVADSCRIVQEKVKETEAQIGLMNKEVGQFEAALGENRDNVETMNGQINSVSDIIRESGDVFRTMEEQMHEIAGIARQINDISFKLTILSLNASVEAAHAGESGSGFEVLAAEMRELSESSSGFSMQVSEVVKELLESVERTAEKISGSQEAFGQSEKTMSELVGSFERLNQQFERLYDNIEQQNDNVNQIDAIFDTLSSRALDMHNSSLTNQDAVEEIIQAMLVFKGNVGRIVENTQSV